MTPDRPNDCALLMAIPLTREDFQEQSEPGSGRDYATLFRTQLAGLSCSNLWAKYRSAVVEPSLRAMESATAHGVLVVAGATLPEWRRAVGARHVLSLVAHWRGAGFTAEVLERLPKLREDIAASSGPSAPILAAGLADDANVDNEETARRINALLSESVFVSQEPMAGSEWLSGNAIDTVERNYASVANEFPEWNLPPAGVELFDGIHRPAAVIETLPPACDATFDLRMCHSFILGEALKWAAPNCHEVMNRKAVAPAIQLPLYEGTLDLLATGRYDFAGAVAALNAELVRRFT